MFERFTDRARRVLVLAQEEARLLNHNFIGSEHILLGLIREGEGAAAQALESLGISLEAGRQRVAETTDAPGTPTSGSPPFTPSAKKVLELSLREALALGHNYIGTEHMLLGVVREGEGVAAQVLVNLGADLSSVRQQVIQLLSGYAGAAGDLPAAGVAISPADIPVEPSALVTWADVEAVLSEGPFVEGSTTERRKAKDLEYRQCLYRPRPMPSISVAVAGARVTPEAFDALEPGEGSVEPVEGLGEAATFVRAAGSLRVLKGSILLVISVRGHANPLAVATSLAEKALDRLPRDAAGPT